MDYGFGSLVSEFDFILITILLLSTSLFDTAVVNIQIKLFYYTLHIPIFEVFDLI